ncbi:MAG: redox-regulated ATPase YchF [Candidatus Yanofskybacteria bacterium]|nr:redox-regulated ATPase YchF [Candidatus Yanofskybacteria bacterium]
MALSIGIVGLPNVGKSTLFKALTNKQVDIQNYPFTTIDPNVGVVAVPDERVDALALMSGSKKKVYTTIEFVDIAGLVKGAAEGEGLGNKFLANIREVDAIAHVVRVFDDKNITHIHNKIDPAEDIDIINTELILTDLETVIKRLEKSEKETKSENKKALSELAILKKFKETLNSNFMIYHSIIKSEEIDLAKELNLLTAKKVIYILNVSEKQLADGWQTDDNLLKAINGREYVVLSTPLELILSEATQDEKKEYLTTFNIKESGLDKLIKQSYRTLGLVTFLTTGEDETRAWTAHIGDPIPKAARAIHTDFEKLFIRAEVINWKTLLESGAWSVTRSKGLLKTVGRDHIIQEGDVVEIKI